MKKLLIIGIIGAVALVAIVRKTNVCSYASTFVSSVSAQAKDAVPTKFELERLRNEIAALDGDISRMVRPIAEYKVEITKMRAELTSTNEKIARQKAELLAVVKDLEQGKKEFTFRDRTYTVAQVKRQVERNTEDLKRLEKQVKTKQQVLEAKEASLVATQEQLAKVIAMKRDFEVELARLEAEEETLAVAKIGSTVKIDDSRVTQIKDALAAVKHRQDADREMINLQNGEIVNIPFSEPRATPTDLNAVRSYLEGNEQPADNKTASNK
jgi:peptidoglycan hydrolase CwlO-like protein